MKSVTVWYKKFKNQEFEHNHIEDGHVKGNKPISKFPSQKGWNNAAWKKEYRYLDDNNKVIEGGRK